MTEAYQFFFWNSHILSGLSKILLTDTNTVRSLSYTYLDSMLVYWLNLT